MKPTIKFLQKQVYGNYLYYPVCPMAQSICSISGRKTLSLKELHALRDNGGFDVTVETEKQFN